MWCLAAGEHRRRRRRGRPGPDPSWLGSTFVPMDPMQTPLEVRQDFNTSHRASSAVGVSSESTSVPEQGPGFEPHKTHAARAIYIGRTLTFATALREPRFTAVHFARVLQRTSNRDLQRISHAELHIDGAMARKASNRRQSGPSRQTAHIPSSNRRSEQVHEPLTHIFSV